MNLIFDFSYISYKALYTVADVNNYLNTEEQQQKFLLKLHKDISYIVNRFIPYVKRVFLCVDSKRNWRYDYYNKYKKNRKEKHSTDGRVNYDKFYSCISDYVEWLSNINTHNVLKLERFEADDLIYLLSKNLLERQQSSIIVASDEDLTQLIERRNDDFIYMYNPSLKKEAFYVDDDFYKPSLDVSVNNIFNDVSYLFTEQKTPIEKLKDIITKYRIETKLYDKKAIILDKIFHKETSDNIGDILEGVQTDKKYTRRATKDMFKVLYKIPFSNITVDIFDEDNLRYILSELRNKLGYIEKTDLQTIIRNMQLKVKLVHLDKKHYLKKDIQLLIDNKLDDSVFDLGDFEYYEKSDVNKIAEYFKSKYNNPISLESDKIAFQGNMGGKINIDMNDFY